MKNIFYFLFLISFLSLSNSLDAQENKIYPTVQIKGYKNALNKKVAKKPIKAELILDLPNIKLYRAYSHSMMSSNMGTTTSPMRHNVDVSDTFWYCLRPGEEVATMVSWTFKTQVNKNNIFRKNATEYFKDYPELSKKIDDKDLKHDDIIQVVEEYNNWKSGK